MLSLLFGYIQLHYVHSQSTFLNLESPKARFQANEYLPLILLKIINLQNLIFYTILKINLKKILTALLAKYRSDDTHSEKDHHHQAQVDECL